MFNATDNNILYLKGPNIFCFSRVKILFTSQLNSSFEFLSENMCEGVRMWGIAWFCNVNHKDDGVTCCDWSEILLIYERWPQQEG